MATLEKRLDALEQAARPAMPTRWRWVFLEQGMTIAEAKAHHVGENGDDEGCGWIVSRLSPPKEPE